MRPLPTRHKTALAGTAVRPVLAARRLLGRDAELETSRRGIRWHLDLRQGIDFAIWLFGSFEPGTRRAYSSLIEPGATVVDIGANIGAHTLQFAKLVGPRGKVVAVEPTAFAYGKLSANLELNPELRPRVVAVQAALLASADAEMPDALYSSWPLRDGEDLHPKHRGDRQGTEGARATTLDRLLAEAGTDNVDVLKIDVDGHECGVLRGAHETLRTSRPLILLELAPYVLKEAGTSVGELRDLLAGAGYELRRLGSSRALPDDADRLAALVPDGGSINVVARPLAAAEGS